MDENTESIIGFLASTIHQLSEAGDNLEGLFIRSNGIILSPIWELTFKEHMYQIRQQQFRLQELHARILKGAKEEEK